MGVLSALYRPPVIYAVRGLTPLETTLDVFTRQASLPIASSLKLVTGKIHQVEKTVPGKGEPSQDVAHRKSAQSGAGVWADGRLGAAFGDSETLTGTDWALVKEKHQVQFHDFEAQVVLSPFLSFPTFFPWPLQEHWS